MKLVVLLSRFPYPLEKGDKLRAYHQLKELSKNHEIYLCCLSDKQVKSEWIKEIEPLCKELHVYKLNKVLIYWNTIKQVFTNKPFQVGYFYQSSIKSKIHSLINRVHPEHIYCQLIRTTEYVKDFHQINKTLDYMDALGKGMLRRSDISNGLKRKLLGIEGKRLGEYENRIFDYFNHHTIISKQDQQHINHPDNGTIEVIENGISKDFFDYSSKQENQYELVFIGNMNYPPNIECASFTANELLPKIKNPETRLLLSGANPHPTIQDLSKIKNVTVSGWVDDIRDSYASGKIFIAPLFIGTGLQNKLLEAMAMGLPCITTSLANNALGGIHKESILIANNAEEFVFWIEELLSNEELYQKIATNGKHLVSTNFNWKNSVDKLEAMFEA